MKKKVPILQTKFKEYCNQNSHRMTAEECRKELIDHYHKLVLEQNKLYFSNKRRQEEEAKRNETTNLEDLIREINSTVNKVVGNSDEESEYLEEVKVPYPTEKVYKRVRTEEEKPQRVTKRPKRVEESDKKPTPQTAPQMSAQTELKIQSLLETSQKERQREA